MHIFLKILLAEPLPASTSSLPGTQRTVSIVNAKRMTCLEDGEGDGDEILAVAFQLLSGWRTRSMPPRAGLALDRDRDRERDLGASLRRGGELESLLVGWMVTANFHTLFRPVVLLRLRVE